MERLKMSELEVVKTLVVSTAHTTEKDNLRLERESDLVHYELGEYGWLIYVNKQILDEYPDALKAYSYGFKQVVLLAQEKGCDYLRLDRDANTVDGLVTYNW